MSDRDDLILQQLERLNARLDRLEASLEPVLAAAQELPALAATAVDSADGLAARLSAEGVEVDAALREGAEVARSLAQPERLAALRRLIERLEALDAASAQLCEAPSLAATAVDALDDAIARAHERGLDPHARLQEGLRLLERATTPETLARWREALDALESVPGLAAAAADVFDGLAARLAEDGVRLDERAENALRALDHLTHPDMIEVLEHALQTGSLRSLLVSTDVFAPPAVHVVGCAARSLIETQQAPIEEVGLFGLLSALRKPEVRRAAGFAIGFAERFGRRVGRNECVEIKEKLRG